MPGADRLRAEQRGELPQKDELCGPFQALIALRAAGYRSAVGSGGVVLDQDEVALAAGTVLGPPPRDATLPPGEPGRGDFRIALPEAPPGAESGTSARGLARAIAELSRDGLAAVPATGDWTPERLSALLGRVLESPVPVALIANLDTGALWDATTCDPAVAERYLDEGVDTGPASRWRVGHFAALGGVREGAAGTLVTVIDSYRSLGRDGVHEQPLERVAAALRRKDGSPRGVLIVVAGEWAPVVVDWVVESGLSVELWDNGSPDARAGGGGGGVG